MKRIKIILAVLCASALTSCAEIFPSVMVSVISENDSVFVSENNSITSEEVTMSLPISVESATLISISTSISNSTAISTLTSNSVSTSENTDLDPYYSSISSTDSGATLRKQIYDLMMATHKTYTTYSGLSTAFQKTDVNPNNSSQVLLFYTGEFRAFTGSFSGTINREHVWPNSKGVGQSGPGADSHHLRPCDYNENGDRGNLGYGSGGYIPTDAYKGIAARIIFYVGAHYGPESSYDLTIVESVAGGVKSFGSLSVLLAWNRQFPVVESEVRRNVAAQGIQGNRNPFIDNPDYACRIWGNTSAATKTACGY